MTDEPKKLIVFVEKGIGGVRYWTNSNVEFDDVLVVEMTADNVSEDARLYDQAYDLEQYTLSLELVEQRMKCQREECQRLADLREEKV